MDRSANIMWSPINNTLPGNAIQKADENPVHDEMPVVGSPAKSTERKCITKMSTLVLKPSTRPTIVPKSKVKPSTKFNPMPFSPSFTKSILTGSNDKSNIAKTRPHDVIPDANQTVPLHQMEQEPIVTTVPSILNDKNVAEYNESFEEFNINLRTTPDPVLAAMEQTFSARKHDRQRLSEDFKTYLANNLANNYGVDNIPVDPSEPKRNDKLDNKPIEFTLDSIELEKDEPIRTKTVKPKEPGMNKKSVVKKPIVSKPLPTAKASKTHSVIRATRPIEEKIIHEKIIHEKIETGRTGESKVSSEDVKSLNRSDARKYMAAQQKKRKETADKNKTKGTVEKDIIKQRLQELRKNTLQIIDHNVKRAKAKHRTESTITLPQDSRISKEDERPIVSTPPQPLNNKPWSRENSKSLPAKSKPKVEVATKPSVKAVPKAIEAEKKIEEVVKRPKRKSGLLRKLDVTPLDYSFKMPDFDEMVVGNQSKVEVDKSLYKQADSISEVMKRMESYDNENEILPAVKITEEDQLKVPDLKLISRSVATKPLKETNQSLSHEEIPKPTLQDEEYLVSPAKKLKFSEKPKESKRKTDKKENIQSKSKSPRSNEIPYWLRPSSVQIYPYNFIMAVRKKLEAVTDPMIDTNMLSRRKIDKIVEKSRKMLSKELNKKMPKLKSPKKESPKKSEKKVDRKEETHHRPLRRANIDVKRNLYFNDFKNVNLEKKPISPEIIERDNQPSSNSKKSYSDLNTNFSSITLNVPDSNTISEVSSIKSDSVHSGTEDNHKQDHKFMENDNENIQRLSPLSLRKIQNLKLQTKKIPPTRVPSNLTFINVNRSNMLHNDEKVSDKMDFIGRQIKSNINIDPEEIDYQKRQEHRSKSRQKEHKRVHIDKRVTIPMDDQASFKEMLETFKKSLNQVIEVNQQLHTALSKSNIGDRRNSIKEIESVAQPKTAFAGVQTTPQTSSAVHYSDDFEKTTETGTSKNKENYSSTFTSLDQYDTSTKLTQEETQGSDTIGKEQKNKQNSSSRTISERVINSSQTRSSNTKEDYSEVNTDIRNSDKSSQTEIEHIRSEALQASVNSMIELKTELNEIDNQKVLELSDRTVTNIADIEFNFKGSKEIDENNDNVPVDTSVDLMNSTIGSDIFTVFNQIDRNVTIGDDDSKLNLSYSFIGHYDQLLNTEKLKSRHLGSLIKLREKSLIDRAKGQVAWLELQKQKLRQGGDTAEISHVRKKQRAILLKMEKERHELQKVIQLTASPKKRNSDNIDPIKLKLFGERNLKSKALNLDKIKNEAVKVYDVEFGNSLQEILIQREHQLEERRKLVRQLIKWHQRLDAEEQQVEEMERVLMSKASPSKHSIPITSSISEKKYQKKIESIEKSLKVLQEIPESGQDKETITTSGLKLNKLWQRLTGTSDEKFNPYHNYHLKKQDIELLYEDAKRSVIEQFNDKHNINKLLDHSKVDLETGNNNLSQPQETELNIIKTDEDNKTSTSDSLHSIPNIQTDKSTESNLENDQQVSIPDLNLNFSMENVIETNLNALDLNKPDDLNGNMSLEESVNDILERIDQVISQNEHSKTIDQDLVTAVTSSSQEYHKFEEPLDESIKQFSTESKIESEMVSEYSDHTNSELQQLNDPSDNSENVDRPTDIKIPDTSEPILLVVADEKQIQDISMPNFDHLAEVTNEYVSSDFEDVTTSVTSTANKNISPELEQRLLDISTSMESLNDTLDRIKILGNKTTNNLNDNVNIASEIVDKNDEHESIAPVSNTTKSSCDNEINIQNEIPPDYLYALTNKMPDIISEAEVLRQQQLQIEQEIKQLGDSSPYVFIREIPNKPPPPYVPPAYGSPLTIIFPTDARIEEIVNEQVGLLYDGCMNGNETVTNIFERLIIDMCREYFIDMKSHFEINSFVGKLTFHRPPDQLKCTQQFILRKVMKTLKPTPITNQLCTLVNSRRKRDHVDETLLQELFEEEERWTNFHIEEKEVIDSVVQRYTDTLIKEAITEHLNQKQ